MCKSTTYIAIVDSYKKEQIHQIQKKVPTYKSRINLNILSTFITNFITFLFIFFEG